MASDIPADLRRLVAEMGELVRFFDPRRDAWSDHFKLDGALIVPLTPQGRVTVCSDPLDETSLVAKAPARP